jgi:hypothetical protein
VLAPVLEQLSPDEQDHLRDAVALLHRLVEATSQPSPLSSPNSPLRKD